TGRRRLGRTAAAGSGWRVAGRNERRRGREAAVRGPRSTSHATGDSALKSTLTAHRAVNAPRPRFGVRGRRGPPPAPGPPRGRGGAAHVTAGRRSCAPANRSGENGARSTGGGSPHSAAATQRPLTGPSATPAPS